MPFIIIKEELAELLTNQTYNDQKNSEKSEGKKKMANETKGYL